MAKPIITELSGVIVMGFAALNPSYVLSGGESISRKASKAARDLLLGMKELPEQGGGWGLLLPRGAEPAELSPHAHGAVQAINPAYLEFVPHASVSNRGMGVFYGVWFFLVSMIMFSSLFFMGNVNIEWKEDLVAVSIVMVVLAAFPLCSFIWAYRSARMPLAPPVLLSRTLRKFYCWVDRKRGWMVLDYDELHPAVFRSAIVTTAGSAVIPPSISRRQKWNFLVPFSEEVP